eukprot:2685705-Pleurochrysis_carterae.AAC.1
MNIYADLSRNANRPCNSLTRRGIASPLTFDLECKDYEYRAFNTTMIFAYELMLYALGAVRTCCSYSTADAGAIRLSAN